MEAKDLIRKLLVVDPAQRLKCEQVGGRCLAWPQIVVIRIHQFARVTTWLHIVALRVHRRPTGSAAPLDEQSLGSERAAPSHCSGNQAGAHTAVTRGPSVIVGFII